MSDEDRAIVIVMGFLLLVAVGLISAMMGESTLDPLPAGERCGMPECWCTPGETEPAPPPSNAETELPPPPPVAFGESVLSRSEPGIGGFG